MKNEHTLQIMDLGANGDGIAHDDAGHVVFVAFTAPGDTVMADIDAGGRGKMTALVKPSDVRVPPPCRHFMICGGCSLQHVNDATYRAYKKDTVISLLERASIKLPETIESIFIPDHTRRRANFAARVIKGKTIIGFHERKSASIRDVPDCLLITEELRAVMEGFRPFIADIAGEGAKMDVLIQCADGCREIALTGKIAPGWEAQQALSDALRTLDLTRISLRPRDYERYEILLNAKSFYKRFESLIVDLAPGAFLQPSAEGEAALTDCVIRGTGDASRVADLFCGNGTFTGPLVAQGRAVTAIDFAPDGIAALKSAGVNAQSRNLFKQPLDAYDLDDFDCVILDPPRAGAQEQARELVQSTVPKIVYVSCNPASFARDAAILAAGGYVLQALTIVDQFIWSPHTELVGIFEK